MHHLPVDWWLDDGNIISDLEYSYDSQFTEQYNNIKESYLLH